MPDDLAPPAPARRILRGIARHAAALAAGVLAALIAFLLLELGPLATYLDLQAASDAVHRLALLGPPIALGLLVLLWMFSELQKLGRRMGQAGRALWALALGALVGFPAFALRFDVALESSGLTGQFVRFAGPSRLGPASVLQLQRILAPGEDSLEFGQRDYARAGQGPYRELSAAEPNLAVEDLPGGDFLVLDRRSLVRKRPDGAIAWHAPRPGRPPATLTLIGSLVLYSGLSREFEDSAVLQAFDLEDGHPLWRFDCLGQALSPTVVEGGTLAFLTARPAASEVHVFDLDRGAPVWARRLEGRSPLPPRLGPDWVEVALGGDLLRLDRTSGEDRGRLRACADPETARVACEAGAVVAWLR